MNTRSLREALEALNPTGEKPVRMDYPCEEVAGVEVRGDHVRVLTASDVRRRNGIPRD